MNETTPSSIVIVSFGFMVWLCSFWWGAHGGCSAYYQSPDIALFQRFADPTSHGREDKFFYLLGPLLIATVISVIVFSFSTSWLDKRTRTDWLNPRPARAVLLALGMFGFAVVARDHQAHAIQATEKLGWHGIVGHDAFVDNFCAVINFGNLFK